MLLLGCASERAAPSAPAPAPPPAAEPALVAPPPTSASAVPDAAPALDAASTQSSPDAAAPPPTVAVDRKRCPLFPPGHGSTPWRAVPSLAGLGDDELRACYGEPVEAAGERRLFFFPRGCSYERSELELTLRAGRVVRARVRSKHTGQHCLEVD